MLRACYVKTVDEYKRTNNFRAVHDDAAGIIYMEAFTEEYIRDIGGQIIYVEDSNNDGNEHKEN